jgi:hypothetical protein
VASSSGSVAGSNGPGGRQASGGSGSRLGNMLRRRPASAAVLLSQPIDHCWLAYKPCSRPDSQVLDRLVQPQPSGGWVGGWVGGPQTACLPAGSDVRCCRRHRCRCPAGQHCCCCPCCRLS